jgi:hypothetical protein
VRALSSPTSAQESYQSPAGASSRDFRPLTRAWVACDDCRRGVMKYFALAGVLATIFSAVVAPPAAAAALNPLSHCGTERWHIKTVDDPGVNHIDQIPQITTVAKLRQLAVPSGFSKSNDTTRYVPVEKTKYTVRARVVGFKEEADRDIHIVIADLHTGATMIVEAPDPDCSTAQESGHAAQLSAARANIVSCFGQPPVSSTLKTFSSSTIVSFTGVGFFDFIHPVPQTGVAPNGIELHPLIAVKLESNCPTGYVAHCACALNRGVTSGPQATQASRLPRRPARTTSGPRQFRRR